MRDSESETVLYTMIAESESISNSQLPDSIRNVVKESSLPFHIKVINNFLFCLLKQLGLGLLGLRFSRICVNLPFVL